jgi:hypothetical protein
MAIISKELNLGLKIKNIQDSLKLFQSLQIKTLFNDISLIEWNKGELLKICSFSLLGLFIFYMG